MMSAFWFKKVCLSICRANPSLTLSYSIHMVMNYGNKSSPLTSLCFMMPLDVLHSVVLSSLDVSHSVFDLGVASCIPYSLVSSAGWIFLVSSFCFLRLRLSMQRSYVL